MCECVIDCNPCIISWCLLSCRVFVTLVHHLHLLLHSSSSSIFCLSPSLIHSSFRSYSQSPLLFFAYQIVWSSMWTVSLQVSLYLSLLSLICWLFIVLHVGSLLWVVSSLLYLFSLSLFLILFYSSLLSFFFYFASSTHLCLTGSDVHTLHHTLIHHSYLSHCYSLYLSSSSDHHSFSMFAIWDYLILFFIISSIL